MEMIDARMAGQRAPAPQWSARRLAATTVAELREHELGTAGLATMAAVVAGAVLGFALAWHAEKHHPAAHNTVM